jgi:hypothetical protein
MNGTRTKSREKRRRGDEEEKEEEEDYICPAQRA